MQKLRGYARYRDIVFAAPIFYMLHVAANCEISISAREQTLRKKSPWAEGWGGGEGGGGERGGAKQER